MTGSDLIVEIPWILFGLFLVGIGFRLRKFRPGFRRPTAGPRDPGAQLPGAAGTSSSADLIPAPDPTANDQQRPTAS